MWSGGYIMNYKTYFAAGILLIGNALIGQSVDIAHISTDTNIPAPETILSTDKPSITYRLTALAGRATYYTLTHPKTLKALAFGIVGYLGYNHYHFRKQIPQLKECAINTLTDLNNCTKKNNNQLLKDFLSKQDEQGNYCNYDTINNLIAVLKTIHCRGISLLLAQYSKPNDSKPNAYFTSVQRIRNIQQLEANVKEFYSNHKIISESHSEMLSKQNIKMRNNTYAQSIIHVQKDNKTTEEAKEGMSQSLDKIKINISNILYSY